MNTQDTFNMKAMLEQQANADPKMRLMYELLQKSQDQEGQTSNKKAQGQVRKLVDLNTILSKKVQLLKRHQKKILKYLNFFIDVNTVFSSAVGACECWGEDRSCPNCHGRGKPGHFQVDERAFQEYVMPFTSSSESSFWYCGILKHFGSLGQM